MEIAWQWHRVFLTCVLSVAALGANTNTQSAADLRVEAVRAVKGSEHAQQWRKSFASAPASDVIAWFRDNSDSSSGSPVEARIRAQVRGETFRLVPATWRCLDIADSHLKARCALEEAPYYIEVGEPSEKADTAVIAVNVYARQQGTDMQWLRTFVYAVRDSGRWRVVRIGRAVR